MVALRLRAATTSEEADALMEAVRRLPEKVPGILELDCGRNFSPARAKGFDLGICVRFAGRAGLEAYGPHPDHQVVSRRIAELCEDVFAVDFEV